MTSVDGALLSFDFVGDGTGGGRDDERRRERSCDRKRSRDDDRCVRCEKLEDKLHTERRRVRSLVDTMKKYIQDLEWQLGE